MPRNMKLFGWFASDGQHNYSPVPAVKDESGSPAEQTSTIPTTRSYSLLKTAALVVLVVLPSFFAGRLSTNALTDEAKTLNLETADNLFQYNRTFGEAPSDVTNGAWEALFPRHGGFFVHPDIAPKRSAFSVFHQMHCLDELRHGFWVLHDQVIEYADIINGDNPLDKLDEAQGQAAAAERTRRTKRALQEHSLGHIRHCIDLLRQSLMCNADLTVERKDDELGGVTGFGTVHRCVNWPALLDWIKPFEETDAPSDGGQTAHDHTG